MTMGVKCFVCLLVIVGMSGTGFCSPVKATDLNRTRRSEKIQDLQTKLSMLRDLLKDIDENELKQQKPESEKTTVAPPKTTVSVADVGDQAVRSATERSMGTNSNKNVKAATSAAGLDALDTETLKALMEALKALEGKSGSKVTAQKKEKIDSGHFLDQPIVDDDDVTKQERLRQLTDELLRDTRHSDHSNQYDASRLSEDEIQHLYSKPRPQMGGAFLDLRQEILEEVEKNLLEDVSLAIQSGISLEEILSDISEKEERSQYLKLRLLQERLRNTRNADESHEAPKQN